MLKIEQTVICLFVCSLLLCHQPNWMIPNIHTHIYSNKKETKGKTLGYTYKSNSLMCLHALETNSIVLFDFLMWHARFCSKRERERPLCVCACVCVCNQSFSVFIGYLCSNVFDQTQNIRHTETHHWIEVLRCLN